MDEGKVLLVNLSKGNLGEERSGFFGTLDYFPYPDGCVSKSPNTGK